MRTSSLLAALLMLALAACSSATRAPRPADPAPGVFVVEDGRSGRARPRGLRGVPPGHYPPPGHCRVWYAGRPPGQQPPPVPCDALRGPLSLGAFLLYDARAWDTEYDWERHRTREPGSVPDVVVRLMATVRAR